MRPLLPLFLDLADRAVLVVGAGRIGARKALQLVACGADVTIVAPIACSMIRDAALEGRLRWHARPFVPADLEGVWLVVSATGDRAVKMAVAALAGSRCLFVNAVDDPAASSAYSAATLHRGPVTIAISTAGRAPVLARLVREVLELVLPPSGTFAEWGMVAERLRAEWKRRLLPMNERWLDFLATLQQRERAMREREPAAGSVA